MLPTSKHLQEALIAVLADNPMGLSSRDLDLLVAKKLKIEATDLEKIRTGSRTEYQYRMAWVRTTAKKQGQVVQRENRFWTLKSERSDG